MDKIVEKSIRKIIWDSYEAGANGVPPTEFLDTVEKILEDIKILFAVQPSLEDCIGPEESL